MTLNKLLAQTIVFWALLVLIIMYAIDFKLPDSLAISDYLMTFHTAGYIAAHGKWQFLYPAITATTFHGAPFDQISHQLLPRMPAWSVSEYMYMPLSAFIFAPYSTLKPELSLLCWQITSLLAIAAAAYFVLSDGKNTAGKSSVFLTAAATLSFLPATLTLWIGQVGLVFGLLPLAAGFHLLHRLPLPAGLIFALLFLKPQMLVLAVFLIVCELAQKRAQTLIGMTLGVIALAHANATVLGPQIFQDWLNCLKLSDKIFSDPANGVAVHLATSLPRAVLLTQPVEAHATLKPIVYSIALLFMTVGLAVVAMLSHKSSPIKDAAIKANLSLILACLALPLVVPHLFIYDLCVIAPAFYLLFASHSESMKTLGNLAVQLRKIFACYWVCITVYCVCMVTNIALAKPLILVAAMTIFYILALIAVVKYLLDRKKIESEATS